MAARRRRFVILAADDQGEIGYANYFEYNMRYGAEGIRSTGSSSILGRRTFMMSRFTISTRTSPQTCHPVERAVRQNADTAKDVRYCRDCWIAFDHGMSENKPEGEVLPADAERQDAARRRDDKRDKLAQAIAMTDVAFAHRARMASMSAAIRKVILCGAG